jgi:hypothetical protein
VSKKRKAKNKKATALKANINSISKACFTLALGASIQAHADPIGVIGGRLDDDDSSAFSALITNSAGGFTSISGLPPEGRITSVDINSSGVSLIAGYAENEDGDDSGYFALLSTAGAITASGSIPATSEGDDLRLISGSINNPGNAIVGGADSFTAYVAQITPDGTVSRVTLPNDGDKAAVGIYSTDLNDSGVGIVGGEGFDGDNIPAYGALVQSDGTASVITGIPNDTVTGRVGSVAINSSGKGIVGGYFNDSGNKILGGFVSSDGVYTTFYDENVDGVLQGVAINESGAGLVGGENGDSDLYAALVSPDGTLTSLFESPPRGTIYSTAINDSGIGILGGQYRNGESNDVMYGAFVSPDGTVTRFDLLNVDGSTVQSVAIDSGGVGLVGGDGDGESYAYAALVAPNGTVTQLDLSALQTRAVLGVALIPSASSSSSSSFQASPTSVSGSNGSVSVQYAATLALQTHLVERNQIWDLSSNSANLTSGIPEDRHLAYNDSENDFSTIAPNRVGSARRPNTLWFKPFGNFIRADQQGGVPKYSNDTWGGLLGYDRQGDQFLAGVAVGYASNRTRFSESGSSGSINQGMVAGYSRLYWDNFWFGASLWGGGFRLHNTRKTLQVVDSKGKTSGWLVSPQIELASPWMMGVTSRYYVEPFALATWTKNWQSGYTETGSSGLNLVMPNTSTRVWQFETGLRFYQKFLYNWGQFRLMEKVSYMNFTPSGGTTATTSYIGSASTFPVAITSSKVQNLFSSELMLMFVPKEVKYPYGGLSGQVAVNGRFQSYFVSLFIGARF